MELVVFIIAGAIVLASAVGVVISRNPVHAALALVATLFGVAVLFVALEANFLAAVQVIVYAGAIVVLFLFVIMLLGVDQAEDLRSEPLGGQRPAAAAAGIAILGLVLIVLLGSARAVTGRPDLATQAVADTIEVDVAPNGDPQAAIGAAAEEVEPNATQLGRLLFSRYVFAFEATAILLTIAVVGAVVLARRPPKVDDLAAPAAVERTT